jgi:hypothetical protein
MGKAVRGNMRILDELSGITFIENPLLEKEVSKQYRFPRSKKKRIRKKWSKLYRKITLVPIDPIFCVEQKTLAMHPWHYELIAKKIAARNNNLNGLVSFCEPRGYGKVRLPFVASDCLQISPTIPKVDFRPVNAESYRKSFKIEDRLRTGDLLDASVMALHI